MLGRRTSSGIMILGGLAVLGAIGFGVMAYRSRTPADLPAPPAGAGSIAAPEPASVAPAPQPAPAPASAPPAVATPEAKDATAPPANPSQALPTRPFRVWAIIIGIDGYTGNIPPCARAGDDAAAVEAWFRRTARWEPDHILVLDDDGGPIPRDPRAVARGPIKATREAMDWALRGWLRARLADDRDGDDIVVVYYAGQAVTLPARGEEAPRPTTLLLPVDARLGDPKDPATLDNGWDLAKALDDLPVPSRNAVLCWLDTSPVGRGKPVGNWGRAGAKGDNAQARAWLDGLRRWQGVSAWLASASGPAVDGTPGAPGPGPFVRALAAGLGTPGSPRSLEECVQTLHGADATAGFVRAGGFPRDLFLWPWGKVQKGRLREPVLQRGHAGEITAMAATPGGELITGGGHADSVVKVWASGKIPRVAQEYGGGHLGGIRGLGVIRPPGQNQPLRLLSADAQGRLVLQNLDPGLPPDARRLPYEGGRVVGLAVAPSGHSAWVLDDGRQVWAVGFDASGSPEVAKVEAGPVRALVAAPPRSEPRPGRWAFALRLAGGGVQLREEAPGAAPLREMPAPLSGEDALPLIVADPARGDWIATADDGSDALTVHDPTRPDSTPRGLSLRGTVRDLRAGPGGRIAVALEGDSPDAGGLVIADVSGPEPRAKVLSGKHRRPPAGRDGLRGQGMAFSADGRAFAAIVGPRQVARWDLDRDAPPRTLPTPRGETGASAESYVSLAFQAVDGRSVLHALGAGGGLTRWLDPGDDGAEPGHVAGRTGGVATLSAASSAARPGAGAGAGRVVPRIGPHILQITRDGRAGLWSLDAVEDPFRPIPPVAPDARYHAGVAWTRPDPARPGPGRSLVALARPDAAAIEVREADRPEQLVARFTVPERLGESIRPGGGLRTPQRLGEVRVSADGRWLAAIGDSGGLKTAGAWAFVWDVDVPGPPRFAVAPEETPEGEEPFARIDLAVAGDELLLLAVGSGRGTRPGPGRAASKGNAATLWALDLKGPRADAVARAVKRAEFRATDHRPGTVSRITAARMLPRDPRWVAVGTSHGRVELFDGKASARPVVLAGLSDRVEVHDLAVAASGDSAYLAAAGDNAEVLFWAVRDADGGRELVPVEDPSRGLMRCRHHVEAVRSIAAAPGDAPGEVRFLTGGHDGTVRFWKVGKASAALEATAMATRSPGPDGTPVDDWVAYAPSGQVDGSARGLEQITLALGDRVRPVHDLAESAREPGLLGTLLGDPAAREAGTRAVDLSGRAPEIRVEHARPKVGPAPRTELKVSLRATDLDGLAGVRLYHNGVPVDDGLLGRFRGLRKDGAGRLSLTVPVALRSGRNAFHALAYRTDWPTGATLAGLDGSSDPVEIPFDGPDRPGATHVVAIGVGRYKAEHRRLAYAAEDAKAIRAYFAGRLAPADPKAGPESDPNSRNTYHTILDGEVSLAAVERAFGAVQRAVAEHPEDTVIVFLAGHADRVDQRRYALLLSDFPFPPEGQNAPRNGPGQELAGAERRSVLEYFRIYGWLSNLAALNRLVIVDACEAERIEDDPGVRAIRADLARTSIRARTVNLLAARRGEPANESSELRHGLLTYALLRGLDAPGLESPPPGLPDLRRNANRDGDEFITAEELRDYTAAAIPRLSASYPALVRRGNADGPPVPDQRASLSAPRHEPGGFAVVKLKR